MPRLIGLSISPWSEKARWALDHHEVAFEYQEYLPLVGAPALRVLTRKLRGNVSVPVLVDGTDVYPDSLAIARYADARGGAAPLFPSHQVEEWNARGEQALDAGRALTLPRLAADEGARREQLPRLVPSALRGVATPVASLGIGYVARKYAISAVSAEAHHANLVAVLEETRARLRGKDFLLGDFSYADIAMAVALHFVRPVADRFVRLGPRTRAAFTQDELAERFTDLLSWRDSLYLTHRKKSGAVS